MIRPHAKVAFPVTQDALDSQLLQHLFVGNFSFP